MRLFRPVYFGVATALLVAGPAIFAATTTLPEQNVAMCDPSKSSSQRQIRHQDLTQYVLIARKGAGAGQGQGHAYGDAAYGPGRGGGTGQGQGPAYGEPAYGPGRGQGAGGGQGQGPAYGEPARGPGRGKGEGKGLSGGRH